MIRLELGKADQTKNACQATVSDDEKSFVTLTLVVNVIKHLVFGTDEQEK